MSNTLEYRGRRKSGGTNRRCIAAQSSVIGGCPAVLFESSRGWGFFKPFDILLIFLSELPVTSQLAIMDIPTIGNEVVSNSIPEGPHSGTVMVY